MLYEYQIKLYNKLVINVSASVNIASLNLTFLNLHFFIMAIDVILVLPLNFKFNLA